MAEGNAGDVLGIDAGIVHGILGGAVKQINHFLGLLLHMAGTGEIGGRVKRADALDVALFVKNDRLGSGGADIDGNKILRHGYLLHCFVFLKRPVWMTG